MNSESVRIITLRAQTASAAALRPYGEILGPDPSVDPLPIDFYGGKAKVRRVVNFVSDSQTEMPVVTLHRRPFEARWMERHPLHTQAFISLAGMPFVTVFAPPSDTAMPDIERAEAFLFDGKSGFVMKQNCWHEFPFAVVDNTNLIVILRREATDGLIRDNVVQDEAVGPDLIKRDLKARLGVVLRVEL